MSPAPPVADPAGTGRAVGSICGAWTASRLAWRGPSLRTGSPPVCSGQPDEHRLAPMFMTGPQVFPLIGSPGGGMSTEC